jgi:hypothetical protein
MIDELCQKYNGQLAKNGRRLTDGDIKRLKPILRTDCLKIRMSISCGITPKLLEDIEMYPISLNQTVLQVSEKVPEVTDPITLDELEELNDRQTEERRVREERQNRAEMQV